MDYKHIHFIGIGGIGMSGIAAIVRSRGVVVSGSDAKDSPILEMLRKQGISVFLGHSAKNILGADLVVYSSAIKQDNPELKDAKKHGIAAIKRAECLAELMKGKIAITVSGAHGKTTTASLASYMLSLAGLEPTAAIGGVVRNWDNNVRLGKSRYFVAEADESDGTFLKYTPTYSVITNIDREHLDYYKDYASVVGSFSDFMQRTKDDGLVIACADDAAIRKIISQYKKRHISFGLSKGCDVRADDIVTNGCSSSFKCIYQGRDIGRFKLSLAGRHNVSNSLAVIALGRELGIDIGIIKQALLGYKGAERRFQVKMKTGEFMVVDDYAHHPTEIKATLEAACGLVARAEDKSKSYRRLIAIFQPHRFSRTKLLLDDFAGSFDAADRIIITDIYPASEAPIPGIDGRLLYEKIRQRLKSVKIEFLKKEMIAQKILETAAPGDLIITLGAGDIGKLSDELSVKLTARHQLQRAVK